MPRRRFRYDPESKSMIEIGVDPEEVFSHGIIGEITPFRSVVDGTIIRSRSQLREYMAKRNLVHYDDARTQAPEADRYQKSHEDRAMRERIYEYVDRLIHTGRGPNQ